MVKPKKLQMTLTPKQETALSDYTYSHDLTNSAKTRIAEMQDQIALFQALRGPI